MPEGGGNQVSENEKDGRTEASMVETASDAAEPEDGGNAEPEAPDAEEPLKKLEREKQELTDQLLRARAEFDNARKRMARESEEQRKYAEVRLVEELLQVVDSFERALPALKESGQEDFYLGVEMIYKQLWETLTQAGLRAVESEGRPFDPHQHHAVERVETTEAPDHQVIEELQKGYLFKDRLLRPALVRVAVEPSEATDDENAVS